MNLKDELELSRRLTNPDLHGRRIVNAGRSVDSGDYVTRRELQEFQFALQRSVSRTKSELILNQPPVIGATEFTDDFNRSAGFLGFDYFCCGRGDFRVSGNQFQHSQSATSNQECAIVQATPGLYGKLSQYIKFTYISSDAPHRGGPAVYLAGEAEDAAIGNLQGYYIQTFSTTINFLALKPGVANYALELGLGTPVSGDVFEILAVIGASSNQVTLWQNGTILADVIDPDAGRPTNKGLAGFYASGGGAAGALWDNLEVRESR